MIIFNGDFCKLLCKIFYVNKLKKNSMFKFAIGISFSRFYTFSKFCSSTVQYFLYYFNQREMIYLLGFYENLLEFYLRVITNKQQRPIRILLKMAIIFFTPIESTIINKENVFQVLAWYTILKQNCLSLKLAHKKARISPTLKNKFLADSFSLKCFLC